jgi:hypothetical protein
MATFRPLSLNEEAMAPGFSHIGIITTEDLTQATVAAAQTITLAPINAGDVVLRVFWRLRAPFQQTTDATFNSDTISVGDSASITTYLTAAEANLNGAYVTYRFSGTAVLYTANDNILVTVNSMAAKALVNLNRGELHLFFGLARLKGISDSAPLPKYNKP